MFCEKCGAKNDSSSKFCEKCGNKLDNDEVKETKKTTKKTATKEETPVEKKSTFSKKQKILFGIVVVIAVVAFALYKVGEKMTSIETIASKAFEQLADKKTISNEYLSVPLDSEEYFVSLEDQIAKVLDDEDIALKYSDYDVQSKGKKVAITYRDKEDREKYKLVFEFEKDGKTMFIFDKYVISKITIKNSGSLGAKKLYEPNDVEKITLETIKGSTVSIDGTKLTKAYLDKKKSDDEKDVYVVKGITTGSYKVEFNIGKLEFERKISVYSIGSNDYDLTDYISSSYLKEDNTKFAKEFKKYLEKYYECVTDESKTIDDFKKEYKVNDDIKKVFDKSKEDTFYKSIKISDVKMNSLYYSAKEKELTVSYKVTYKYTTEYTEEERETYSYVRVNYDIDNLELPTSLSYLPY